MSFFFDIWMQNGFILASDVRLIFNGEKQYLHKIIPSPPSSKIKCALAVCGDYPENSIKYFNKSISIHNSLRAVAKDFAEQWTSRYAGTEEYSAVHIVGYECEENGDRFLPQVWYWKNWSDGEFLSERELIKELNSFSDPIPQNNHLPWKFRELFQLFPIGTFEGEYQLVSSLLTKFQPIFTWNGDNKFWRSATDAVNSALNLLYKQKNAWTLEDGVKVAKICLIFLTNLGELLPESTVGSSQEGNFDILLIKPSSLQWIERASF